MPKNKEAQRQRREERTRQAIGRRPKKQRNTHLWLAVAAVSVVVVAVGGMVAVRAATKPAVSQGSPRSAVPAAVLHTVTTLPAASFDKVGLNGGDSRLPVALHGTPSTIDGKPGVLYMGAEYCPYCAAERWAVVAALSRFGTFKNLGATHSSSTDVYPNTATFSFHGATYSSPYLSFQGVEMQSNKPEGGTYARLDTPTPLQRELLNRYDAAPYFNLAGAIPFIDFANRYAVSGAGYVPSVLAGMSMREIAHQLDAPSTEVAQAILGTANRLSAAVCAITSQQPAKVCQSKGVTAASSKLADG